MKYYVSRVTPCGSIAHGVSMTSLRAAKRMVKENIGVRCRVTPWLPLSFAWFRVDGYQEYHEFLAIFPAGSERIWLILRKP